MQTLLEYVPWIVFGVTYKFGGGLYPATAALMVVMTLLLAYFWIRARKVPQMHLVLTIMVLVFGAATLLLHDVRFLQWKASVILLAPGPGHSPAVAGSAARRCSSAMLGGGIPEDATVPADLLAQRFADDAAFSTCCSASRTSGSP